MKLGIVGKTDAMNPNEDDLSTFKSIMKQQFELGFIDFSTIKEIDRSYKTILIFDDNTKEYSLQETEVIKNYIDKGGKAIFFVDGVWVQDNLTTSLANHNLLSLL